MASRMTVTRSQTSSTLSHTFGRARILSRRRRRSPRLMLLMLLLLQQLLREQRIARALRACSRRESKSSTEMTGTLACCCNCRSEGFSSRRHCVMACLQCCRGARFPHSSGRPARSNRNGRVPSDPRRRQTHRCHSNPLHSGKSFLCSGARIVYSEHKWSGACLSRTPQCHMCAYVQGINEVQRAANYVGAASISLQMQVNSRSLQALSLYMHAFGVWAARRGSGGSDEHKQSHAEPRLPPTTTDGPRRGSGSAGGLHAIVVDWLSGEERVPEQKWSPLQRGRATSEQLQVVPDDGHRVLPDVSDASDDDSDSDSNKSASGNDTAIGAAPATAEAGHRVRERRAATTTTGVVEIYFACTCVIECLAKSVTLTPHGRARWCWLWSRRRWVSGTRTAVAT
jgi:hypothetical protein